MRIKTIRLNPVKLYVSNSLCSKKITICVINSAGYCDFGVRVNYQNMLSLVDCLQHHALHTPQKIGYIFLNKNCEETLSYQSLDRQAKKIAVSLLYNGLKKGDKALLIFTPGIELIEAFFGCLYAGVVAIPIAPPINDKLLEKTQRIIFDAAPKIMLMRQELIEKLDALETSREILTKQPCIATDTLDNDLSTSWHPLALNAEDIAFFQYTSGSTRHPKGVMVSHHNLLDNLSKINHHFAMNTDSVMLGWLPPYHDMGLIGNILSPLYGGYPTVLMSPFSFLQNPLSWLQSIDKYQATISGSPNFAYDYCVKRIKEEKTQDINLTSWQVAFNGAEPLRSETMERFYQAFKHCGFRKESFYPCYGLAEATLLVTGAIAQRGFNTLTVAKKTLQNHRINFIDTLDEDSQCLVSSGYLIQDVKIVNPDTSRECSQDNVGEIWVNSPSVAMGYWQHPEETTHAFHGKITDSIDNKIYLRTGDLGFVHLGELYVTGRIKDLIILYGKNHYPQDIEYTLMHGEHHKALVNSAAFVIGNDDDYQLTVMCELKNRFASEADKVTLLKSLIDLIYHEHQLNIRHLILVPSKSIPLTTSGKVRRQFCKQHLLDGTFSILAHWHAEQGQHA